MDAVALFASTGGGSSTYPISVNASENGTVQSSASAAASGNTVTLAAAPAAGHALASLNAKDAAGNALTLTKQSAGVYTFSMPASKVTVTAVFAKELPFTDVAPEDWAYDSIAWAFASGYMNGSTETTFQPAGTVTRQQLWMVLARRSGEAPATMADAKTWAVAVGISDGSNPGGTVSRQQMVTILYRYAQSFCGLSAQDSGAMGLAGFEDAADIAPYAYDAMHWAVTSGILQGSGGKLNPAANTSRAQFAVLLNRFCDKMAA